MAKDDLDDLDDIPPPPTLRRQIALDGNTEPNQIFIDTATSEIVHGNPDMNHWTNRNLVKLIKLPSWGPGQCTPGTFFSHKKDEHDEPHQQLIVGCTD